MFLMNFNIYVNDELGAQIERLAKVTGRKRNAIINEALREWVARYMTPVWPGSVLEFIGDPSFPPFERDRDKLKTPSDRSILD